MNGFTKCFAGIPSFLTVISSDARMLQETCCKNVALAKMWVGVDMVHPLVWNNEQTMLAKIKF